MKYFIHGRQPERAAFLSLVKKISGRLAVLVELALGLSLIEATIWTAGGTQRVLFWISAAWLLLAAVLAVRRGKPSGLKPPPWRMALLVVGLTLLLAALALIAAATLHTLHGLFGTRAPLLHASVYLVWALVQQYIQQSFFFVRIEALSGNRPLTSFLTALLFGLVHLPNPVLMLVTFLGDWVLSELFRRYRSSWPLAFAHGVMGLTIAVTVPDQLHHHMRVGLGYLRYR
ncbi:MAG: CAAX protease family protein [Candidatus Angelobacter sp. Gp1-AA117]|nr:MAG: CAAX protease family protein [Candidatus Angelobacter sp. Gp1-AA117]